MPNLLLDTNAAYWALFNSRRLGKKAVARIGKSQVVAVSSITLAELVIKSMKGKLTLPNNLEELVIASGFELVPFTANAAAELANFTGLIGHDVFDRMLLAQAASSESQLLTSDSVLLSQGFDFVVDAQE